MCDEFQLPTESAFYFNRSIVVNDRPAEGAHLFGELPCEQHYS